MDLTQKKKLFLLPFIYYYSLSITVLIIGVYLLAKLPQGSITLSFAQSNENDSTYVSAKPQIILSADEEFKTEIVKDLDTGNIKCDESEAKKIDDFFSKTKAPLSGYGCDFVYHADENNVDHFLVAAIAMCESGGGKKTNYEYNAWGYGVTSSKSTNDSWGAHICTSWEECIGRVTRAISRNSYKGTTTLEIAEWYNGGDKGKWASCVNQYMEEIKSY